MKLLMIVILTAEIMLLPWLARLWWQIFGYLKELYKLRADMLLAGSMFHTSGKWKADVRRCLWGMLFAMIAIILDVFWIIVSILTIQIL